MTSFKPSVCYKSGQLFLMNHRLSTVVRKVDRPTYVYSFKRISEKLKVLRESFQRPLHVHYSMKANSNRLLLKKLKKEGVGVDVVSGGEIERALECGFRGSEIIFSGVGKSVSEITFALKNNIQIFNVESPQELERLGQISKKLTKSGRVSFRLNPNVNPVTHPYITTGFRKNKFGMDRSFLPELLQILKRHPKNLTLVGLDFHIGSQLFDIGPFEDAAKLAVSMFNDLRAQGFPLTHFDIGGGIGVPYDGQKGLDVGAYGRRIEKLLKGLDVELVCEPGRFLVADAGVLLTRVEYIKNTPYKNFVIVNTGMHHLIRPALYQAFHQILPVTKMNRASIKTDVVGPICESSDWLAQDRPLQKMKPGEWLAICDAGAYGFVMASDYNLHEKPLEILLD